MSKKHFMDIKKSFDTKDPKAVSQCTQFVEECLKALGTDRKLAMKCVLLSEEMAVQMILHAPEEGTSLAVRVKKSIGDAVIQITCEGESFDPFANSAAIQGGSAKGAEKQGATADTDTESRYAISSIIMKSLGELFKFSHKDGVNRARIATGQEGKAMIMRTVIALLAGLAAGLILKFLVPADVASGISEYALTPVRTMFMNALKIVIAPVVFFSIVTCISQFRDLSELGRIGSKVMGMYITTTVIAVLLASGLSFAISPGKFGQFIGFAAEKDTIAEADTSILNTIVNIVPSNIVQPFLEADTLQLIFLAVLTGIAVAVLGKYSKMLQELFEALNSLFLTITTMITRFIPVAIFCSIALIILNTDINSLKSILGMAGTFYLGIFCMLVSYGLLILIFGRLNPLTFYRKHKEGMLTSMALSSSSAAMPTNLRICTEKLGISPKVCNFSIPLGATVNMDGSCIFLTIGTLFLAKGYGINVTLPMLLSLLLTIVLLSLGAPGVPGVGIVCLGIALQSIGVPIEAVGILIGIYPFFDMFTTMSNTTGDVAAALIVARNEGLVDLDVYKKK